MWNTTTSLRDGMGSTHPGWISTSPGGIITPFSTTFSPESNSSGSNTINTTEFDMDAYLETYLGAKHLSIPESAILTLVYCLIFLTGVIGNVFTCIVITRNNYMHTATNYYLFSLAISDVLTLIIGKSV